MAGQRMIVFDPQDLYHLMIHYSDGALPLGGRVLSFEIHPLLGRMCQMKVESKEWEDDFPMQFRYECNKVLTWDERSAPLEWKEGNEPPKRQ